MIGLRVLIPLLDSGTGKYFFGHLRGTYKGRRIVVSENSTDIGPPFWDFSVDCRVPLEFEILPDDSRSLEQELGFPKTGLLGFGRDDEINDQQLDSIFAFSSSDPPRFSVWLHNPHIKRSLIALAFHSRHITLRNHRIQFSMEKSDLLTVVEEVLRQLCSLASSVEQTFPYPSGVSVPLLFPQDKRIIVYFVIGGLLAAIVYYLTL